MLLFSRCFLIHRRASLFPTKIQNNRTGDVWSLTDGVFIESFCLYNTMWAHKIGVISFCQMSSGMKIFLKIIQYCWSEDRTPGFLAGVGLLCVMFIETGVYLRFLQSSQGIPPRYSPHCYHLLLFCFRP